MTGPVNNQNTTTLDNSRSKPADSRLQGGKQHGDQPGQGSGSSTAVTDDLSLSQAGIQLNAQGAARLISVARRML